MSRSRAARLAPPLLTLLLLPVLSCDRGNWRGAPEGYNYRTAHIAWKLEGDARGTSEEYIETAGYKDGKLLYKRIAIINNYEQNTLWADRPPRQVHNWVIIDQDYLYNMMKPMKRTYKTRRKLDQQMRVRKNLMWREMLAGVILRPDLSQAQRTEIKERAFLLSDAELGKLGVKITTDTFLGHKVKRYDIPLNQGRGLLLLYGDIVLKKELNYRSANRPVRKLMVATTFELNEKLPEAPFTPPKSYKLIDETRKVPGT